MENQRDECFADMYVHPQEIDYTVDTLFDLIETVDLDFLGFSNPQTWNLERLLGQQPDLWQRTQHLSQRQQYQLIECLDPDAITHFEFFLGRPPLPQPDWSDDQMLLRAVPVLSPCLDGWPSNCLFNYAYEIIKLSDAEVAFLSACEANQSGSGQTIQQILTQVDLDLVGVRSLQAKQLILLALP